MPVTIEQVRQMRAQLKEDRVLCANSAEAQTWLDEAEGYLESLELDALRNDPENAWQLLPEIEARLNREVPSEEHTAETIKAIREVQGAIRANPPACDLASECLRILINHLDVLERKRMVSERVHTIVRNASDLREEIQECDAILKQNSDLRISAELVFSHVEKTLAPALSVALDTPLQDTVTQ